jgi:hypothetical protein
MTRFLQICILFLLSTSLWGQAKPFAPESFARRPGISGMPSSVLWTPVQAQFEDCASGGAGTSTCTTPNYMTQGDLNFSLPTTAGSVKMLCIMTGNAKIHIVGVTSYLADGTNAHEAWGHLTSQYNPGNDVVSCAETVTGVANVAYFTIATSGDMESYAYWYLEEALPPAGYTAAFDVANTTFSSTPCTTCLGVGFSGATATTGTDVIFEAYDNQVYDMSAWNSCGSTFNVNDQSGGCDGYNVPAGVVPAPSFTLNGSTNYNTGVAMAFKSIAGPLITSPVFKLVNYTVSNSTLDCSPTCTLTIPSTTSGNLGYLVGVAENASSFISRVSGCGRFSFPSGSRSALTSVAAIGSAYNLSLTGSCTSITITMSPESTITGFAWYEVSRTSGLFALDVCNAGTNSASNIPSGVSGILRGRNDVAVQAIFADGGANEATMYVLPYAPGLGATMVGSSANYFASSGILLNTTNGNAPTWAYPDFPEYPTVVNGCWFK